MTLLIFSDGLIDKEFPGKSVIILPTGAGEGRFDDTAGRNKLY
jgi:hypothetical protein